MVDEKEEETWNYAERRSTVRKKISLKKTFSAEIQLDTTKKCYLYIVDISQGGMKIMTDIVFPERRTFLITFYLEQEDPLELAVEVVWKKQVVGYMNVTGMKFVAMSPKSFNKIEQFVSKYSIDTSKRIFKLNRMITMQIAKGEEWENFYAYILSISPQGLEYTTDYNIPQNEEFPLRFYAEQGQAPMEAVARILFQKEISMGRLKGWLEIVSMSEPNRLRLTEYIDKLLQGDLPARITAPLADYNLDLLPEKEIKKDKKKKSDTEKSKIDKIKSETEEATEPDDMGWIP